MKKKITLLVLHALLISVTFNSYGSSYNKESVLTTFIISTNSVKLNATNLSTATFTIQSDTTWNISISANWLNVDKSTGKGNSTITITAKANPDTTLRTTQIKLSSPGSADVFVEAIQNAALSSISVSYENVWMYYTANSISNLPVKSNIHWSAVSSQPWLKISPGLGYKDAIIVLTAQKNPTTNTRTATITLTGYNVPNKVVTVTQIGHPPLLALSTNILGFGATTGLVRSFEITSNTGWKITNSDTLWISSNKKSGNGNSSIELTLTPNKSDTIRTARIWVSATGTTPLYVDIVQSNDSSYLELSTNILSMAKANGSTSSFTIESNTNWNISGATPWLSADKITGSGDATIQLTALLNPADTVRTAVITVKTNKGLITKKINIIQSGDSSYVNVSTNTFSISKEATITKWFAIQSNTDWNAATKESWIELSDTAGSGNKTITLTLTPNPNSTDRTGQITITSENLKDHSIKITQNGAPSYVNASTKSIQLGNSNASTSLVISSNIDWKLLNSVAWLTADTNTGEGIETITLTVASNDFEEARSTEIIIESSEGNLDTVTVTQKLSTTSVANLTNNLISIYPNPVKNTLYIANQKQATSAQIYGLTGKLLISEKFSENTIDVSILPKGFYIIKLITDKGSTTQRLVKE